MFPSYNKERRPDMIVSTCKTTEDLCKQIEDSWEMECYEDVEDFFGVSKIVYQTIKDSLRSLDIDELIELRDKDRSLMATLNLAMFSVIRTRKGLEYERA